MVYPDILGISFQEFVVETFRLYCQGSDQIRNQYYEKVKNIESDKTRTIFSQAILFGEVLINEVLGDKMRYGEDCKKYAQSDAQRRKVTGGIFNEYSIIDGLNRFSEHSNELFPFYARKITSKDKEKYGSCDILVTSSNICNRNTVTIATKYRNRERPREEETNIKQFNAWYVTISDDIKPKYVTMMTKDWNAKVFVLEEILTKFEPHSNLYSISQLPLEINKKLHDRY